MACGLGFGLALLCVPSIMAQSGFGPDRLTSRRPDPVRFKPGQASVSAKLVLKRLESQGQPSMISGRYSDRVMCFYFRLRAALHPNSKGRPKPQIHQSRPTNFHRSPAASVVFAAPSDVSPRMNEASERNPARLRWPQVAHLPCHAVSYTRVGRHNVDGANRRVDRKPRRDTWSVPA